MNERNKIINDLLKSFKTHLQNGNNESFHFNPDNHDQINMAISILNIESNEKLSESNDRHSRSMNWLTGGLLFVAIIQLLVSFGDK